jgi:hypothetical protein
VALDRDLALERALETGDDWQSWRALRLSGDEMDEVPPAPYQEADGGFVGPSGRTSPGATGEGICHLRVIGLHENRAADKAAAWLLGARTPAEAWLDAPEDVPGELDNPGGARVWATASACCALHAMGRDPGHRAMDLLRGEADMEGRFTGGAYATFAAAGAYWLAEGPKTEMAEWALRWARETETVWDPWETATGLTFWAAAGIPSEHPTVESFAETLRDAAPAEGWADDLGLTLRTLEVLAFFGD